MKRRKKEENAFRILGFINKFLTLTGYLNQLVTVLAPIQQLLNWIMSWF